VEILKKD